MLMEFLPMLLGAGWWLWGISVFSVLLFILIIVAQFQVGKKVFQKLAPPDLEEEQPAATDEPPAADEESLNKPPAE